MKTEIRTKMFGQNWREPTSLNCTKNYIFPFFPICIQRISMILWGSKATPLRYFLRPKPQEPLPPRRGKMGFDRFWGKSKLMNNCIFSRFWPEPPNSGCSIQQPLPSRILGDQFPGGSDYWMGSKWALLVGWGKKKSMINSRFSHFWPKS